MNMFGLYRWTPTATRAAAPRRGLSSVGDAAAGPPAAAGAALERGGSQAELLPAPGRVRLGPPAAGQRAGPRIVQVLPKNGINNRRWAAHLAEQTGPGHRAGRGRRLGLPRPSNTPLSFQALDERGQAVQVMRA